eukprot:1575478-Pleurochrysis_carterae.AAC.1
MTIRAMPMIPACPRWQRKNKKGPARGQQPDDAKTGCDDSLNYSVVHNIRLVGQPESSVLLT